MSTDYVIYAFSLSIKLGRVQRGWLNFVVTRIDATKDQQQTALVVVRYTEHLESQTDVRRHFVIQSPVLLNGQVRVLVWQRVLNGIAFTVTQEGDLEVRGALFLGGRQKDAAHANVAAIQGTRDLEDSALVALGVVDHPALVLAAVVRGGAVDRHESNAMGIRRGVREGKSKHFKGEVAPFGQRPDHLLETVLEVQSVLQSLLAIGYWRPVVGESSFTLRRSIVIAAAILGGLRSDRDVGDTVVRLWVMTESVETLDECQREETYVREVEGIHKVAHVLSAPRVHRLQLVVLITLGLQPFLDEEDLRSMVTPFGEHSPTASPRRHDPGRDTETGAGKHLIENAQRILHPLALRSSRGVEGDDGIA